MRFKEHLKIDLYAETPEERDQLEDFEEILRNKLECGLRGVWRWM